MYLSSFNVYLVLITLLSLLLLIVYFYFQKQLSLQKRKYLDELEALKRSEQNKHALLSSMGDDIYQLTKTLIEKEKMKEEGIEEDILTSANNLRELLKIQANAVEVYQEVFQLTHMLDDISTYLASNFSYRNTEVLYHIDPEVPRVLSGDLPHLSRIVNNLLEFCISLAPEGKVVLAITSHRVRGDDIILHIKVEHDTTAVSKEDLERFFALNYHTKKEEQASIRLYIAKKLTLAIGGTIESESRGIDGNTFMLQVPLKASGTYSVDEKTRSIEKKRVAIVSDKRETGISLQKLFSGVYSEVLLYSKADTSYDNSFFMSHDMILLDAEIWDKLHKESIRQFKRETDFDLVIFDSIFSHRNESDDEMIDAILLTPTHADRIWELARRVAKKEATAKTAQEFKAVSSVEQNLVTKRPIVYKEPIEEAKNIDIDCFTYFRGARLLIVEDNMINQKIVISVLKKSGMLIEIANNGQEALDMLSKEKKEFDIILMDISMPVLDGIKTTKQIRQHEAYSHIPIITFTAFAMGSEIEAMFDAGANAYITKPLNVKKLYGVFYMFLSQTSREVPIEKEIQIEGLDIQTGIYHADESEALYKETLKEFVLVYTDMIELMPKWLKEKRYERVKLACNEIEGILGAIGAYEMKELVGKMQKNFLYGNEAFLDEYIVSFPTTLKSLMDTISGYLQR